MDDASNAFWLAIGVFYEAPRLANAIAELRADGTTSAQMCLVGIRQAIDALAPGCAGDELSADRPRVLAPRVNDLELVATDGQLLRTLLEHTETQEGGNPSTHGWLLPDLFGSLTEHLRAGAVALLVSASDFGLQRCSSRILLRNTAHTVQTHEFTPRRSGTP
jgi:hypothetical protein